MSAELASANAALIGDAIPARIIERGEDIMSIAEEMK